MEFTDQPQTTFVAYMTYFKRQHNSIISSKIYFKHKIEISNGSGTATYSVWNGGIKNDKQSVFIYKKKKMIQIVWVIHSLMKL